MIGVDHLLQVHTVGFVKVNMSITFHRNYVINYSVNVQLMVEISLFILKT